ncbi:MAG: SGNH hydrolase domain-containing protein, partial [Cellvibrionaceae bacterium]
PPLLGVLKANFSDGNECTAFNESALNYFSESASIKTVVLHARWALSVEGSRYSPETGIPYELEDTLNELPASASNEAVVELGLDRVIAQLVDAGKQVIIVDSVPEIGFSVPRIIMNNLLWGKNNDVRPTRASFNERQLSTQRIFSRLRQKYPDTVFIKPADKLCDEFCQIELADDLLYFDDDHLSNLGAGLVAEQIKAYIR